MKNWAGCTTPNFSHGTPNATEGDGSEGKKEKNKNYSWYSAQGLGRMAQSPQAGTGDSVS